MADETNYIRAFEFHGMAFTDANQGQKKSDCPFCGKVGHFYVKVGPPEFKDGKKIVDGMWSCHHCDESGNVFTFLNKLIKYSQQNTEDYGYLWKAKRIPSSISKLCGLCRSVITGEWLIPTCKINDRGNTIVTNIHKYWEVKNRLFGTTGMNSGLLGLQFLSQEAKPLWIVEGHWDWLIMEHVLRKLKRRKEFDVLSVPGAKGFKSEWVDKLLNRDVYLVFDNDYERKSESTGKITKPGYDGMIRIAKMCESLDDDVRPRLKFIQWPEGLADGFDVRDLFMLKLKETKK